MNTLAEALPQEIERVQEIIKVYEEIPAGRLTATMMKNDIKEAMQAMVSGDTVKMIRMYEELKQWEL